ncbi:MAG: NAD-binding protein [Spirochaetia bacterium]|nr:NAD-binding protein [Spirochaetia bacterium]
MSVARKNKKDTKTIRYKLLSFLADKENKIETSNRVVIVGAGQVGLHIMERLSGEGYDIILIDGSEEMLSKSREIANVATIVGNGCDPEIYSEIKLNRKDVFLAVTDSDETNLVACNIAQTYGCRTKIARVRQPFYRSIENTNLNSEFWEKMGVQVLFNQDWLTINEIQHLIDNPGTIDTVFLNKDTVQIAAYKVKPGSLMTGRRLIGLRDVPLFENILVVAVNSFEARPEKPSFSGSLKKKFNLSEEVNSRTIIPKGDYKISEGDLLYLAGVRSNFSGIGTLFGPNLIKDFTKIFILGGSILSRQLAEHLLRTYPKKKIFLMESIKKDAFMVSESLDSRIHVLLTSPHDMDSLMNEGLDKFSIYIAASKDEDDNVLSCLLAKEKSMARTISIVQSNTYSRLVKYLDIDAIVSPKSLLVEDVLRALRHNVYDVLSAKEHDAEILEFVVPESCALVNQRLREFRFPGNAIIAFVFRGEEIIIPRGEVVVKAGDHLVIFSLKSAIEEVLNIFQGK